VVVSLFEIALVPYDRCPPERGIVPDIPIAYDEDTFRAGRDPYLAALQQVAH
jgi:hypothetical protein